MPHCRSAQGAWNHAQKSYQRGYLSHPPAANSVELPPPPPPPPIFTGDEPLEEVFLPPPPPQVFRGVEQTGNRRRVNWVDVPVELEPPGGFCQSYYIGDCDDVGYDIEADVGAADVLEELEDAPAYCKDCIHPVPLCLDALTADFSCSTGLWLRGFIRNMPSPPRSFGLSLRRIIRGGIAGNTDGCIIGCGEADTVEGIIGNTEDCMIGNDSIIGNTDGAGMGVEFHFGQEVETISSVGTEVVAANNRETAVEDDFCPNCVLVADPERTTDVARFGPTWLHQVRAIEEEANVCIATDECENIEQDNIGDRGYSVHAAQPGGSAIDAVVGHAESELAVVAGEVVYGEEAVAYRNDIELKLMHDIACPTVSQESFNSRLLHCCSFSAFLKAIYLECARTFCSGITTLSSVLDLSDFVDLSADLCKKHQADICALINMHDVNSLQQSIFDEQVELLVECVRKVLWCKIISYLHEDYSSFMAICENRPHKAFRRHVTRVTVEVAKFFYFPDGKYANPFVYSELLTQVDEFLVPLCKGLNDHFTPPACAACSSAVLDFV